MSFFKYAQIDIVTGICRGVSFLSGEVEAEHMILLSDEDDVSPMDALVDGEWVKYVPPDPEPQGPTVEEQFASLQAENDDLKLRLGDIELIMAELITI